MAPILLMALAGVCGNTAQTLDDPRPIVPTYLYVDAGDTFVLYKDAVAQSFEVNAASYTFASSIGSWSADKLSYSAGSAGDVALTVEVGGGGWRYVESTTLRVTDDTIATTTVVLVGDSLTDNAAYPPAIDALCDTAVTFEGTQTDGGTANEGSTGATYCYFATNAASPFRSGGAVNIANYRSTISANPDVLVWMFGTNGTVTSQVDAIDAAIAADLACADTLISAWLVDSPNTKHIVVLPQFGSNADADWPTTYPGQAVHVVSGWQQTQKFHRANELYDAHWSDSSTTVLKCPAYLSVSRTDAYVGNASHPNQYTEVAAAVRACLAWLR